MRVFYLSEGFSVHDRRFIEASMLQGHSIIYTALKPSYFPEELLQHPLFKILEFSDIPKTNLKSIADIAQIGPMNRQTLHLIHSVQIPTVFVSWGSDVLVELQNEDPNFVSNGLEKASAFIADCSPVSEKIRSYLKNKERRIFQFPWGVDVDRYLVPELKVKGKGIRRSLGWTHNEVFVSVRKWETSYGIEEVVEAFRLLHEERRSVRMILAATGSMKSVVLRTIDRYKLKNIIFTPGVVEERNLPEWLYAGDVYVSGSKSDGSSISLLEAMICELPVITHNDFGNKDWVLQNINGWPVNCHDPKSIKQGMEIALDNHHRWKQIGETNRRIVLEKANWKNNSLILSEIYEYLRENHEK